MPMDEWNFRVRVRVRVRVRKTSEPLTPAKVRVIPGFGVRVSLLLRGGGVFVLWVFFVSPRLSVLFVLLCHLLPVRACVCVCASFIILVASGISRTLSLVLWLCLISLPSASVLLVLS